MLLRKIISLVVFAMLPCMVTAQVVQWSTYLNTTGFDNFIDMVKDNAGDIYVLGTTNSNGFPVTSGAVQTGTIQGRYKYTVSKISGSTGALVWSTYLGSSNDYSTLGNSCKLYWDNASNSLCVWVYSRGGDFPVVNGNLHTSGVSISSVFAQLDRSTGSLLFSTYLFDVETMVSYFQNSFFDRVQFDNGFAWFLGVATNGKTILISKLNLVSHSFVFQKKIHISNGLFYARQRGALSFGFTIDNGAVYFAGITSASDYPVTAGTYQPVYPSGAAKAYFITKLDAAGDIVFSTFANKCSHPEREDFLLTDLLDVHNGEVAFAASFPDSIPVSSGGVAFDIDTLQNTNRGFLKLNSTTGSLRHFSYLGPDDSQSFSYTFRGIKYTNGNLILYGITSNGYLPVTNNATQAFKSYPVFQYDFFLSQVNPLNSLVYSSYLGGKGPDNLYLAAADNNDIYFTGSSGSRDFPVTANALQNINKGGSYYNGDSSIGTDLVIVKYSAAERKVKFATFLGTDIHDELNPDAGVSSPPYMPMSIKNFAATNGIITMAATSLSNGYDSLNVDYPVSRDALFKKMKGLFRGYTQVQYVARINSVTGKLIYGSYICGLPDTTNTQSAAVISDGNDFYIGAHTSSSTYPVTAGAVRTNYLGGADLSLTKISLCYFSVSNNSLTPASQVVCSLGIADSIIGSEPLLENTPVILRNNMSESQAAHTDFVYQWQQSRDNISWEMIDGAIEKDYKPAPSLVTRYYRRLARQVYCNSTDTSSIATVSIGGTPGVLPNGGGVNGNLYACAGTPVTLGGPALPGITYKWLPGRFLSDSTTAQPVCSAPAGNFTYVLYVTRPGGCITADTVTVYNYKANAGRDKSLCPGTQLQVGEWPLPGVTGVSYNWQPSTGLSCSNCAQPAVVAAGTYLLNVSVPLTNGGTCVSSDTVNVRPNTLPLNPAGSDATVCDGNSVVLGTARVADYNYNWSPGVFLSAVTDTAQPVYNPWQLGYLSTLIVHNPISYILTATNNTTGCTVIDTVQVLVPNVSAGRAGCRPLQLGRSGVSHGQVNAVYQWVLVNNGVEVPVPAGELSSTVIQNPVALYNTAITGLRIYRIKMTLNGVTCTDDVYVGTNCIGTGGGAGGGSGCSIPVVKFSSRNGCPRVDGTDSVTLTVVNPVTDFIYTWSPATGLNTATGTVVKTGATGSITYTCKATYKYDAAINCSGFIKINTYNTPAPLFNPKDTTVCGGTVLAIGVPSVTGVVYNWQPDPYYAGPVYNVSNPQVTAWMNVNYYATATDTLTGCAVSDTVRITVRYVNAYAGPQRASCNDGGFTLGSPALTGFTYQWQPATGLSDPAAAQPTVISNTANIIYALTVTDTVTGCRDTSAVLITHTNTPELPVLQTPAPVCPGSIYGANIGTNTLEGVIYSWTPTTGLSSPGTAFTVANPPVTTTYTLQAVYPGGCVQSATQQVTVTVRPRMSIVPSVVNGCDNSQINVSTNASNPYYTWQPYSGLDNYYSADPTATVNSPTRYTVTVTDQSTSCTDTASLLVVPTISADAGRDTSLCPGLPFKIGTPGVSGIQYNWSPAAGLSNANTAQPFFTASQPGVYFYTLTVASSSCTKTDYIRIAVLPLPDINMAPGIVICRNSSIQIGTTPQNGFNYSWSPAGGLSDAFIPNPFASPQTTTAYTLTVTNTLTGCSASFNTIVTVNNENTPVVTVPNPLVACPGRTVQLNATVTPPGSYAYQWLPDIDFVTSRFISNPVIQPRESMRYTVTVSSNTNGCSTTVPVNVMMNDTCSVVPVTWLVFTAVVQNGRTNLSWSVGMEQDNTGFTIERSADGLHWEQLIFIRSRGNTYLEQHYQSTDADPYAGINYYRVKQTDRNGRETYSVVRSVDHQARNSAFVVYPNPANDLLFYEWRNNNNAFPLDLFLYSIDGKLVKNFQTLRNKGHFAVGEFPAGMYILVMMDGKGIAEKRKVLLRR